MTDPAHYTDLSALSQLVMELPRTVGLDLSLWNSGLDLNGHPTIGVGWKAYEVRGSHLYPELVSVRGFSLEGPVETARHIREQLTDLGVLPGETQ